MFSLDQAVRFMLVMLVALCIFGLFHYLIGKLTFMAPYQELARTILLIVGVLFLIGVLLSLIGYPLVRI